VIYVIDKPCFSAFIYFIRNMRVRPALSHSLYRWALRDTSRMTLLEMFKAGSAATPGLFSGLSIKSHETKAPATADRGCISFVSSV